MTDETPGAGAAICGDSSARLVTFTFSNTGLGNAVMYDFYIGPRMSD